MSPTTGDMKLTPAERSWVLYDVGNSAFTLVVITTLMPVFFKEYAAAGTAPEVSTWLWGLVNSIASLLLAVSAPVLGAAADTGNRRAVMFRWFVITGALFTVSFVLTHRGGWLFALLVFGAARYLWSGANVFYDSYLPDITSEERADTVSSRGYAWGYIGSVVPFLVVLGLVFFFRSGETIPPGATKAGFIIVAVWWLSCAVPLFRTSDESRKRVTSSVPSFRMLLSSLSRMMRDRNVRYFLPAYFFYIDGVDTIISMSAAYGTDIGLGAGTLILAILMIQLVAFPFTLAYGQAARRFGAKTMLLTGIAVYGGITLLAFMLPVFDGVLRHIMFWVLAVLVATSMGGIQALSRSFFSRLIPIGRSAEYFGVYNMFGKFAAIIGPFLMGFTGRITGHSRWGVLSIGILFIIGALLLTRVSTPESCSESSG